MLVPCQGCKNSIDSEAAACPQCGKPTGRGKSKKLKYVVGGFVALVVVGGIVNAGKTQHGTPSTGGASSARANATPVEAAPATDTAAAPAAPAIDATVTALKLWDDYEANEVAADNAYKAKHLKVTGTVAGVDKDFMDDIVVRLRSRNQFMDIHASVQSSEASKAAALSKGASVTMICKGDGRTLGVPVLKKCTLQ